MIANCGKDENGKYYGGVAGDQTGEEWYVRSWYDAGWIAVFRHPDEAVRALMSTYARAAANNDLVGYDQYQRTTFWTQLAASGYNPANISTACEADCSAGVAAIIKAVGYTLDNDTLKALSINMYTGNQSACLTELGFVKYTSSAYVDGTSMLIAGDVLMSSGHTTIWVSGDASDDGIMADGTLSGSKLEIDGQWGPATTRAMQTALGTTVDGIVSRQNIDYKEDNPGLLATSWNWVEETGIGSPMVSAMQKTIGLTGSNIDGICGPITIKKLQGYAGTTVDGEIWNPSTCVKAVQTLLNAGEF